MKISRVRWENWDAVRCVAGECELIVGVSAGPRILSLRRGAGPNLLYRDTTNFRIGDWRLHGGHRFTVGPEGDDSYLPDNLPCAVELDGDEVRVFAPRGGDGLQRGLSIGPAVDGAGFDLCHRVENHGPGVWRGVPWAITCVPDAGVVVAPCGQPRVRFWPEADRAPWLVTPGCVVLRPRGTRTKAGWHSAAAWVASLQPAGTLVVHCPDANLVRDCADGGCNVEVFACGDYVELETLGALVALAPGGHVAHRQRWRLLAAAHSVENWMAIGKEAGCGRPALEPAYAE